MGKILVVFLCVVAVVVCVCGLSTSVPPQNQNPESNTTKIEIPEEFLTKLEELGKLEGEFKKLKSSLMELSSAFVHFHHSLIVNSSAGESGENEETRVKNPDSHSITSCSVAMEILPSPRSPKQWIYPHGNATKVQVLCDFEVDGGGWTVIQKRSGGPKYEFHRDWEDYAHGFGSLSGNFWLGLENIYALTKNRDQELRIKLEDFEGEKRFAKYSNFSVSNAADFYRLALEGFSEDSTAEDSLTRGRDLTSMRRRFATKDMNDGSHAHANCAASMGAGGWWFRYCTYGSLNGLYLEKGETVSFGQGIIWHWPGHGDEGENNWSTSLAKTEMKIRTRKPESE